MKAPGELLRALFLHHDGVVLGPTVAALTSGGVLERIAARPGATMGELAEASGARSGYLHVALRCLALQGWLDRDGEPGSPDMGFRFTAAGARAAQCFDRYAQVSGCLFSGWAPERHLLEPGPDTDAPAAQYARLVERLAGGFELDALADAPTRARALRHLEGLLVAPAMIAIERGGIVRAGKIEPVSGARGARVRLVVDLLAQLGWAQRGGDGGGRLTDLGQAAHAYALHYGLTWSYYPLLCRLPQLLFGDAPNVTHVAPGAVETHVDRTLNVLASGVAHRPYFEDADGLIVQAFDAEPLEMQPRFVADMGCGDGAWLARIYEVVRTRTRRGRALDRFPLLMVGADYNVEARAVAREKLTAAGVPNVVLFGDVADPARLEADLAEQGLDIRDGLHVRAFIDHNRPWRGAPRDAANAPARSTGAFADEHGEVVPNAALERELSLHLARWVPYVERHGLIIIEAHDVDPRIARNYPGRTHATAIDTYHGYSNQYPVDFGAFAVAAQEAGLCPVIHQQETYPTRLPFVAISLNRFLARASVPLPGAGPALDRAAPQWQPRGDEDTSDGEALHRLLYEDGDLTRPRGWGLRATGLVVRWALQALRRAIGQAAMREGDQRRVLVADYGAGTGLAAIELIKAMRDQGLFAECERRNVRFVLAMLDLPGGWFARGYELLGHLPYVEFYSLTDPATGRIRLATDALGAGCADVVIASMVFHLIPPKAMPKLCADLARLLRPGGELLWSTPDTGPALPAGSVIHGTSRALRHTFLAMLDDPDAWRRLCADLPPDAAGEARELGEVLADARARLTPERREQYARGAGQQILARSTEVDVIASALAPYFDGEVSNHLCVMPDEDALALALLPANQRNLGEIADRGARERLIRLLMRYAVLPAFHAGPSGCAGGYFLHWTLGRHAVRDTQVPAPS